MRIEKQQVVRHLKNRDGKTVDKHVREIDVEIFASTKEAVDFLGEHEALKLLQYAHTLNRRAAVYKVEKW
jgi:hypothetical protein